MCQAGKAKKIDEKGQAQRATFRVRPVIVDVRLTRVTI